MGNLIEERMRARLQAFKEEQDRKRAIEEAKPKEPPPSLSKEYQKTYQTEYRALKKRMRLSRMSEDEKVRLIKEKVIGYDYEFVAFLRKWKKELKESLNQEGLSEFQKYYKMFMIDKLTEAANNKEKREEYKSWLLGNYASNNCV